MNCRENRLLSEGDCTVPFKLFRGQSSLWVYQTHTDTQKEYMCIIYVYIDMYDVYIVCITLCIYMFTCIYTHIYIHSPGNFCVPYMFS